MEETSIAAPKKKNIVLYGVLGLVAILFSVTFISFIYRYTNAAENFSTSFKSLRAIKSLSADIRDPKNTVNLHIDYHSDTSKFSRILLTLRRIDPKKKGTLKTEITVNKNDLYSSIFYSHMKDVIKMIAASQHTNLEKLKSYTLLKPVLFNQKPIHLNVKSTLKSQPQITDQKNIAELNAMLEKSLIVRSSNWRLSKKGLVATRYSIGFNKERLLAYIDRQIALANDEQRRQLDVIRPVIESTNNWGDSLIIVDVDTAGYPTRITVYAPKIPKNTLDIAVKQKAGAMTYLKPFTETVNETINTLSDKKNKQLKEILSIRISRYNNAPKIKTPRNAVEFAKVMSAYQKDMEAIKTATPSPTIIITPRKNKKPLPSVVPSQSNKPTKTK